MNARLDAIDRKILTGLQSDGRMTITELSDLAGLSKTACTERVRRLEREGHITGYRAVVDPVAAGLAMTVFVQVQMDRTTTQVLDWFNSEVKRIPEVEAVHMIAGGFDYLLKVRVRDMRHYRKVLGDRIGTLAGVSQTHTYAVMETVVENNGVHPALL